MNGANANHDSCCREKQHNEGDVIKRHSWMEQSRISCNMSSKSWSIAWNSVSEIWLREPIRDAGNELLYYFLLPPILPRGPSERASDPLWLGDTNRVWKFSWRLQVYHLVRAPAEHAMDSCWVSSEILWSTGLLGCGVVLDMVGLHRLNMSFQSLL